MTLPYYQEAEKAISNLLLEPKMPITQILSRLSIEDFYNGGYRTLFGYMKELHDNEEVIEPIALGQIPRQEGRFALFE